jgi:hypothetical protein
MDGRAGATERLLLLRRWLLLRTSIVSVVIHVHLGERRVHLRHPRIHVVGWAVTAEGSRSMATDGGRKEAAGKDEAAGRGKIDG